MLRSPSPKHRDILSLILLAMIYWSFQSGLIMYYGKNCPNIGDEWQCWWEWPSLGLPLWPEMDTPSTETQRGAKIQAAGCFEDAANETAPQSHCLLLCTMCTSQGFDVTYPAAIRTEISGNKGAAIGGLNRMEERGRVFRHMDERRLASNQRATKTGRQSVPINISWMTSL